METSSVFVALVGRPNVGKSSLTNCLVGEKVAIVTSKPQTTRTRITGVITKGPVQYVFMDTPGIHKARTKLGERMTQASTGSLAEVDVCLMLFEPYGELNESELALVEQLKQSKLPAYGVINKTDTLKQPQDLEERRSLLKDLGVFRDVVDISVKENRNCQELFALLEPHGEKGPHYFPDDAYTDMPEKALVSEIIREKALLNLRDEIPHGIAVTVERFKERQDKDIIDIDINIYCERKSHKGMIIGKGGQMLKKIASQARVECEDFLGAKVNLQCWVKVKEDWRDSDFNLNDFGFRQN